MTMIQRSSVALVGWRKLSARVADIPKSLTSPSETRLLTAGVLLLAVIFTTLNLGLWWSSSRMGGAVDILAQTQLGVHPRLAPLALPDNELKSAPGPERVITKAQAAIDAAHPAPRGEADPAYDVTGTVALDVNGEIFDGDWKVKGIVTELKPGKVTFKTTDGRIAHFVYLTNQIRDLSLKTGDRCDLNRTLEFCPRGLSYELNVFSGEHGDRLVLKINRRHGVSPEDVIASARELGSRSTNPMLAGVTASTVITADPPKSTIRKGNVQVADIPLRFNTPIKMTDADKTLSTGDETAFQVDNQAYKLTLTKSQKVSSVMLESRIPVEGTGYTLEYMVTPH